MLVITGSLRSFRGSPNTFSGSLYSGTLKKKVHLFGTLPFISTHVVYTFEVEEINPSLSYKILRMVHYRPRRNLKVTDLIPNKHRLSLELDNVSFDELQDQPWWNQTKGPKILHSAEYVHLYTLHSNDETVFSLNYEQLLDVNRLMQEDPLSLRDTPCPTWTPILFMHGKSVKNINGFHFIYSRTTCLDCII